MHAGNVRGIYVQGLVMYGQIKRVQFSHVRVQSVWCWSTIYREKWKIPLCMWLYILNYCTYSTLCGIYIYIYIVLRVLCDTCSPCLLERRVSFTRRKMSHVVEEIRPAKKERRRRRRRVEYKDEWMEAYSTSKTPKHKAINDKPV